MWLSLCIMSSNLTVARVGSWEKRLLLQLLASLSSGAAPIPSADDTISKVADIAPIPTYVRDIDPSREAPGYSKPQLTPPESSPTFDRHNAPWAKSCEIDRPARSDSRVMQRFALYFSIFLRPSGTKLCHEMPAAAEHTGWLSCMVQVWSNTPTHTTKRHRRKQKGSKSRNLISERKIRLYRRIFENVWNLSSSP